MVSVESRASELSGEISFWFLGGYCGSKSVAGADAEHCRLFLLPVLAAF